jgi:hypothetical protein
MKITNNFKCPLTFALILISFMTYAQPQGIGYQAVLRTPQLAASPGQLITIRFTIQDAAGRPLYQEQQSTTANEAGQVSLVIGKGPALLGKFDTIRWADIKPSLVTEVLDNATNRFVRQSQSDFMSVPYALNSSSEWKINGGNIYRASGNVGIGVQNPTSALDVFNSITMSSKVANKWPALIFNNHNNKTKYFEMPTSGALYLYDPATQNYDTYWDNVGRVGIGTTNPQAKLHVEGTIFSSAGVVTNGRLTVDLTGGGAGSNGRDGLFLNSSSSNTVSSIITNTNTFYFYSTKRGGDANIQAGQGSFSVIEVRGADIIEKFKSKETIEAGKLVTIDETDINNYKMTDKAYQKGVVGIVSGANGVKHGMLLEQDDALAGNTKVAIAGRVYVKATTQNGVIKAGDMLTSSDKAGYAMKATNQRKAFGSVVGKALTSLAAGEEGYVLVLVSVQ